MSDQPRNLAKEVEPFMQVLTEAAVEGVECTITNEMARSLSDFIASQSRELEEMRNSIKALVDGPPAQMSSPLGFLPIDSTGMRTLVDEVCKLQSELAALRDERNDWHKLADERSAEIVRLDRELRRQSEQPRPSAGLDEEVERIRARDRGYTDADIELVPCRVALRDRRYLLSALDQAQRENRRLSDRVHQFESVPGMQQMEFIRAELNDAKRFAFADHPLQPSMAKTVLACADQLLAAYNEAQREVSRWVGTHHGWQTELERVMGERDAARERCEQSERDLSQSNNRIDGHKKTEQDLYRKLECFRNERAGDAARIERLEGALRKIRDDAGSHTVALPYPKHTGMGFIFDTASDALGLAAADGQQKSPCKSGWTERCAEYPKCACGTGDGVEGE